MEPSTSELERQLFQGIQSALVESVKSHLNSGYKETPLTKLIDRCIQAREPEIKGVINDALDRVLTEGGFRDNLRDAISHKLAKVMVSKCEGEVEKQANNLRSSPEFRARLTLAVGKIVDEINAPK